MVAALVSFKAFSISHLENDKSSLFENGLREILSKAGKLIKALEDKRIFDKLYLERQMTSTLVAIVYESKEISSTSRINEMFVDLLTGKWDATERLLRHLIRPSNYLF